MTPPMSKYTIMIQWSEEDQCYVVLLPEFETVMQPVTHGETYEEALKNAQEVLELLAESAQEDNEDLPAPVYARWRGILLRAHLASEP